jgi:molybdate transport system substrate-binding protein
LYDARNYRVFNFKMIAMRNIVTVFVFNLVLLTAAVSGSVPHQERRPGSDPSAAGVGLAIAASEDLKSPLTELGQEFEQKTGERIQFTFADSASLLRQIRSGPAFDAVFLPEMSDVRRLAVSGAVTSNSVTEYARDPLVLCFAPSVHIEPRLGNPLLLLTDKRIPLIAIASPQHTAFGKITVQALTAVHIYDPEFKRKLVVGQDVAEVAQLLEKGGADVALLPGSAIHTYQLTSLRVIPVIPNHVYSPIRKGAGVLKRSKHPRQALEFLRFAASPEGRAIFRRAGFDEPQRAAKR